jgi:hypothetical protein
VVSNIRADDETPDSPTLGSMGDALAGLSNMRIRSSSSSTNSPPPQQLTQVTSPSAPVCLQQQNNYGGSGIYGGGGIIFPGDDLDKLHGYRNGTASPPGHLQSRGNSPSDKIFELRRGSSTTPSESGASSSTDMMIMVGLGGDQSTSSSPGSASGRAEKSPRVVMKGYIAALKDGFGFIETMAQDGEIFFHSRYALLCKHFLV